MAKRSQHHHELPRWLQRRFSPDGGKTVWFGVKASREVKRVGISDAFSRSNANTRTDYVPGPDGALVPKKSDVDERILAQFDSQAASAACRLVKFARECQRVSSDAEHPSPADVEICKRIIIAQLRRTLESQDEIGLSDDKSDLYLDLLVQRAEDCGQELPPRHELLENPDVMRVFANFSQNLRANFASGNHPILAEKEREFMASHGLRLLVVDADASEFVLGSHGVTVVDTPGGGDTWLPVAPDVAIALSDTPGSTCVVSCMPAAAEAHNRAALSASAFVAGRTQEVVERLLASLD